MDFFEHQDRARKRSGRLVVLFILGVLGTIAAIDAVFYLFIKYKNQADQLSERPENFQPIVGEELLLMLVYVSLAVLAVIVLGTLYKLHELRGGGHVVAESLGGRLLDGSTQNGSERKVLNVVEEMAIAAGTPVPPVYMMDEDAINAFAAGYHPDDAVIGVTRGCVKELSRDELQGVIAHEFSHILNGDMRLSIRLIGILYGILAISLIGRLLIRVGFYSGAASRKGNAGYALAIAGVALAVIGAIGLFFGKWIKAAFSRQREFLADASAVQFTRDPSGLGGALDKIRGFSQGSLIQNPRGSEISHMFFSEGFTHFFGGMFATHPPLDERIGRVLPQGLMQPPKKTKRKATSTAPKAAAAAHDPMLAGGVPQAAVIGAAAVGMAMNKIGQPSEAHIAHASKLIQSIPKPLIEASRNPYSARALVYASLLNEDGQPRQAQLQQLETHCEPQVFQETLKFEPLMRQTPRDALTPLMAIAVPALKQMSASQYQPFKANLDVLIEADDWVELYEWVLKRVLTAHLEPHFTGRKKAKQKYRSLAQLKDQCTTLLTVLAHSGHSDPKEIEHAFGQAAEHLKMADLSPAPIKSCDFTKVDAALNTMNQLAFAERKRLIEACVVCVAADKQVTVGEGELLRAISDSLDCPMPPLLPGQKL